MQQTETPCLFNGVMIVYEKGDLIGILDYLSFLIFYRQLHDKKDDAVPAVFVDKNRVDPEKLFAHLNNFPSGADGEMSKDVITQIFDADYEFFEDYMDHLEDIIVPNKESWQEDEEHPIFPTYDFFLDIEFDFFPLFEDMH